MRQKTISLTITATYQATRSVKEMMLAKGQISVYVSRESPIRDQPQREFPSSYGVLSGFGNDPKHL
jgi:hypothetical protein